MKRNVGGLDRALRIILGIAGLAVAIYLKTWLGVFPLLVLVTGLTGRCGVYYPLGASTCRAKEESRVP